MQKSQLVADAGRAVAATLLSVLVPAVVGILRVLLFGANLFAGFSQSAYGIKHQMQSSKSIAQCRLSACSHCF